MFYIRRRLRSMHSKNLFLWLFALIIIGWLYLDRLTLLNNEFQAKMNFVKLVDDVQMDANPMARHSKYDESEDFHYRYNNKMPLIFIGGVPRSGTTLMRAMLDAHPHVRCGEETRILPRIVFMRNQWFTNQKESERLRNAGISDEIVDSAISSFMLEVMIRHGKPAPRLCNKDPLLLRYSTYISKLFPNSKYILMIRDGRATVHSIIKRKVTITGFNLNSYRECMIKWNSVIESMLHQCMLVGSERCLPVYYEQLVLHPKDQMNQILNFLNITWNDAVLHHEDFIGDEISLSKVERSSDQVIKPVNIDALSQWVGHISDDVLQELDQIAPMLSRLGYDTKSKVPNYGNPDSNIMENTFNIRKNKDFWVKLAQQYSIHSPNLMEQ